MPRRSRETNPRPTTRCRSPPTVVASTLPRRSSHGLIERVPHTNTYTLTTDGTRVAVFYTKVHNRVLRPLLAAADHPPAPIELRRAMTTIDRIVTESVTNARLGHAA